MSIFKVVSGFCLTVAMLGSCATKPAVVTQQDVSNISLGEGFVYDINNGQSLGKYQIKSEGNKNVLSLSIEKTKAISTYDGTKDFKEYTGTFISNEDILYKGNRIIKFINVNDDNIILLLTTQNSSLVPSSIKELVSGKNIFTISIMDKETSEMVLNKEDKNYNPVFTVYAIKTFMITQALLIQ